MIRTRVGEVLRVTGTWPGLQELEVRVEGRRALACNYVELTGPARAGDKVILNTTAVYKKLGTGGSHFVLANLSCPERDAPAEGHIMKMRYSPAQVKVLAVEEPESPFSSQIGATESLSGLPVIVGTLHSMLAPAAAAFYSASRGKAKIVYVMTDGAALPLPLSKLVRRLKEEGLIQTTITCGHAFGGDLEAVNAYTALLAAKAVAQADVAIVTMGPGIVGTASRFGYTGVEQGEIVNAVNILGGRPVAIPRISFADRRQRHYGLSHHTQTALGKIALTPCQVPLPFLDQDKMAIIHRQLNEAGITEKHRVVQVDGSSGLEMLARKNIKVTTMGRSVAEDPDFFLAASAAGELAHRISVAGP